MLPKLGVYMTSTWPHIFCMSNFGHMSPGLFTLSCWYQKWNLQHGIQIFRMLQSYGREIFLLPHSIFQISQKLSNQSSRSVCSSFIIWCLSKLLSCFKSSRKTCFLSQKCFRNLIDREEYIARIILYNLSIVLWGEVL